MVYFGKSTIGCWECAFCSYWVKYSVHLCYLILMLLYFGRVEKPTYIWVRFGCWITDCNSEVNECLWYQESLLFGIGFTDVWWCSMHKITLMEDVPRKQCIYKVFLCKSHQGSLRHWSQLINNQSSEKMTLKAIYCAPI